MKKLLFFLLTLLIFASCSQQPPQPFVEGLEDYPILQQVLGDSAKYQVQILYTQVDRNEHGNPLFTTHKLN